MADSSVIIVGAGLAGLCAARRLQRLRRNCLRSARSARWPGLDAARQIRPDDGEAGGELIDEDQSEIRDLARDLGLAEQRILRSGFAHYRLGPDGDRRIRSAKSGWNATERALEPLVEAFKTNEQEWAGPIAQDIARRSVGDWLEEIKAPADVRATATTMRNFFVADPADLSLLVYVDQLASGGNPAGNALYRIRGGNDRLVERLARGLGDAVRLRHVVRKITQTANGVQVRVESNGRTAEVSGACALVTAPASLAAEISFVPELPVGQRDALGRLRYGAATKTLLQFDRASWRRAGKPRACATDLAIGAVWDGSEASAAGRGCSRCSPAAARAPRRRNCCDRVALPSWLGFFGVGRAQLVASESVSWEDDPWARGAYAVFDSSFPLSARPLLRKPFGRIFFAGEHTSGKWQGYMNGAIASGYRAAEEISFKFLG